MKVLMVCLGNICRSPMAQGILEFKIKQNSLSIEVDSAGTASYHVGQAPDQRAIHKSLQKGIDIKTKKPANEHNEVMVKRVYVLYYTVSINPEEPDKDVLFSPMIVPVHMEGPKWDINMIEMELVGKKTEIEECLDKGTVPPRGLSPYRCPYCDFKVRCFYKDRDKNEEIPEEIRGLMGKRSPMAKAQELKG